MFYLKKLSYSKLFLVVPLKQVSVEKSKLENKLKPIVYKNKLLVCFLARKTYFCRML